jgi:hypothetical protein
LSARLFPARILRPAGFGDASLNSLSPPLGDNVNQPEDGEEFLRHRQPLLRRQPKEAVIVSFGFRATIFVAGLEPSKLLETLPLMRWQAQQVHRTWMSTHSLLDHPYRPLKASRDLLENVTVLCKGCVVRSLCFQILLVFSLTFGIGQSHGISCYLWEIWNLLLLTGVWRMIALRTNETMRTL